ncbi:Pleiotropic drug resistance protein 1 [Glycine max]|nr:Pleiotropic drug resistance protein 1 [Glycine max]
MILAIFTMTVFLRTEMHRDSLDDGGVYAGALFFAVIVHTFNGLAEMSMKIVKLRIFYKQRDLLFYPSWAYAIPSWILKIPIAFIEATVWVFLTYYVIGFDPNVGRLLKQYLMLLLINQMASALFRVIAALGRNLVVASTCGYFALVVLFALGGFVLSIKDMKSWWIWGYWISPLMYEQNTIMVNEFLGNNWNRFTPNSNKTLGIQILESRGYFTHEYWYWIGIGALIGFMFLFNIIYTLALTYLKNSEITIEVVSSSREKKRGMVLPFEPYCITFDQIVYSVDMPQITVNNKGSVSGAFSLGVLTALMGVSGAGKTTLLDVLAGRKTGGNIEGNIKVSGYPKRQETFARISGYCEQNDIHSPHVTVYESLVYSAWLRLPAQVESNTRKNPLKNSLVGLPVNGILTEQRKRLTIAVELVANPSIIFMDEPTSGLDARAAAIVMRTVRNTVDTGRTVVCTIHQPSIDIFEAFDELFLMKHGGQEMYVVPLGPHSSQLVKYFESIEGVSKIKDCYNPATWMLEVTTSAQELTLGVDFHEIYKNSELCRRNKLLIAKLGNPIPGSEGSSFSYSIRSVTFGPMLGLLMETTLVLLAQSAIHCCEISCNYCGSLDVWNNVLGPRRQILKQTRPV